MKQRIVKQRIELRNANRRWVFIWGEEWDGAQKRVYDQLMSMRGSKAPDHIEVLPCR